jgi:D-sedoheptulose 7-phosphate isomerase
MNEFAADYLDRLSRVLSVLDRSAVDKGLDMIRNAWARGAQIVVFGNGGSSITALHFVTDWNKSIPLATGRPFLGRTLVDNIGLLMAYANDMGFESVFEHQLRNILRDDDLVIAISGSGNSENVIRAVEYAKSRGVETLGLCGFDGGKLRLLTDEAVWAEVNDMQLSEDVHAIFGHIVMQSLCSLVV